MSFIVEDTGGSFTPVPAGMHLARCYRIIDLGTQKTEFEGNVDFKRKLKIVWEIHGEDDEGKPIVTSKNEPMIITKDYTMSWGDKATLRKDLQSWRGKPFTEDEQKRFDLKSVLGFGRVMGVTLVVAAVQIVLLSVLATLFAFLYNLAVGISGGLEVTLAEES